MLRVAVIVRNVQDAQRLAGVGRPLWRNNGTTVPASGLLAVAEFVEAQRLTQHGARVGHGKLHWNDRRMLLRGESEKNGRRPK